MNATSRRVRLTVATVEEQLVLHILSVCFSLDIQHAMRMRRIVLLAEACPTRLTFFYIILRKKSRFSEKVFEYEIHFVNFFYNLCPKNFSC